MTKPQAPKDDVAVEAEVVEEVPVVTSVPAPNNSARPNDNPIGEYAVPNSSFADRARARSKNKRVEASASK